MSKNNPHTNYQWRKARDARVRIGRTNNEPCCRCGAPIDYTLSGRNPDGPTADHLDQPLAFGGDLIVHPDELGVAHNRCNSRHGGLIGNARRNARRPSAPPGQGVPVPPPPHPHQADSEADEGSDGFLQADQAIQGLPVESRALNRPTSALEGPWSDFPYGGGPGLPGDCDGVPRAFPGPHVDAVDSRARQWIPWIEVQVGELRWWQRLVLWRGLEVDAAGEFCWRRILVTTPRQVGKSVLLGGLALARMHAAGELGETQTVLHLSMNLMNAGAVMAKHWPWAHDQGYRVVRSKENMQIETPAKDAWMIRAAKSAFGVSAGCIVLDEAWELTSQEIASAVIPTLSARAHGQFWAFSTANNACTDFVPRILKAADAETAVMGWWAPADADPQDWEALRAASPFHDKNRELPIRLMWDQRAELRSEFLNVWPDVAVGEKRREWVSPDAWAGLAVAELPAVVGPRVAVIDSGFDKQSFTVTVAGRDDQGRIVVRTRGGLRRFPHALQVADEWGHESLVVGISWRNFVSEGREATGYGRTETTKATGLLRQVVDDKLLVHDGGEELAAQVRGVRIVTNESGDTMSGKSSAVDISGIKTVAWAVLHLSREDVRLVEEEPAIF